MASVTSQLIQNQRDGVAQRNKFVPANDADTDALAKMLRKGPQDAAVQGALVAAFTNKAANGRGAQIQGLRNQREALIGTVPLQLQQGLVGWYFCTALLTPAGGTANSVQIVFMLFRNGPSATVPHAWTFTRGYTSKTGAWIRPEPHSGLGGLSPDWITEPGGNRRFVWSPGPSIEFRLPTPAGPGLPAPLTITLSSGNEFSLTLQEDPKLCARYQGPGGCAPCIGGTGTSYWSLPAMQATGTVDGVPVQGIAWTDRQWGGGSPLSFGPAFISTVSTWFKAPPRSRWLWFSAVSADRKWANSGVVSLTSDEVSTVGTLHKSWTGSLFMKSVPETLDPAANRAQVTGDLTVVDSYTDPASGQVLPTAYRLTHCGPNRDKTCMLRVARPGSGTVFVPTFSNLVNSEAACSLYDESGENVIGTGCIEANMVASEEDMTKFRKQYFVANGVPSAVYVDVSAPKKTPFFASLPSAILFLGGVLALLTVLGLIVYAVVRAATHDPKRNDLRVRSQACSDTSGSSDKSTKAFA